MGGRVASSRFAFATSGPADTAIERWAYELLCGVSAAGLRLVAVKQ
jgi:hypothetical protein